jgi:hypothetical protein
MKTNNLLALAGLSLAAACEAALGSSTRSIEAPAVASPSLPNAPETPTAPALAETKAVDIGALLAGITDGPSAATAKGPLASAIGGLETALAGAGAKAKVDTAAAGGGDAASNAKKMAGEVLSKFGLGAGTGDTIGKLLDNAAVKSAIGPTLERLQQMLPN